LHALESSGVKVTRLFVPAAIVALLTVFGYLAGNEFVAIPFNARLSDLRRFKIERRAKPTAQTRRDVYFVGETGRVFFMREYQSDGMMRDFSVKELDENRKIRRRIDGREARYQDSAWVGYGVELRTFAEDGSERLFRRETLELAGVTEKPEDFLWTPRPVIETSTRDLRNYIARLRRAGENVADEEVEYHYRFSYSLIGLVIVLLGLPLAVKLRRGGVMFGLGLGLLVSFLYWGAIQMSRAYGTSHVVSPALAAWLPNIVFGAIAVLLWFDVRQ
jgi:lipopolysaccharide export system permease protein